MKEVIKARREYLLAYFTLLKEHPTTAIIEEAELLEALKTLRMMAGQ